MGGTIDPSGPGKSVQPGASEVPAKKPKTSGRFKQWRTKWLELFNKVWSRTDCQSHSDLSRAPEGIERQKIPLIDERRISRLSDERPGQEIRELLKKRPESIASCQHIIHTLKVERARLVREVPNTSKILRQQINRRIDVLSERLVSSCSTYRECQLKRLETEAALDLIPKSNAQDIARLRFELRWRLKRLNHAAGQASRMDHLTKGAVYGLTNYPKDLVKMMVGAGLKVTVKDIKKSLVARLNREQWHTVDKTGSVMANGKEFRFQQLCTPGCRITGHEKATGVNRAGRKKSAFDIFPADYQGRGVGSHDIQNMVHATNLFTSRLVNQETGQIDLAVVRHGVNSPYGVKPVRARAEGALNRAKEVVVAALTLKPELLKKARQGEVVSLMVTSNSLLTPDPFRRLIEPSGDEKLMLKDQLAAYKALCREKPVTLMIKTPGGQLRKIRVNLELIPFNFGVNKFAVNAPLDELGGWKRSDSINSEGLQRLIGSITPDSGDDGLVGQWLRENEGHPDTEVVRTLMNQVREIYRSRSHRTLKGGAYKMTSRLIALTWLIGGVPCTNCKSGKDRTSMSVATAEALIAHIHLYGNVPDWKEVSEDQSHLVKEFCLQGGHHEIQRMNTGVPGFKIQKEVLQGYGMNEFEIAQVRGLSDTTSS